MQVPWLRQASESETDECLDWPFASMQAYGRPVVSVCGKQRKAAHVLLELAGRPCPTPGLQALHSCDRPICCNPRHLRWGTPAENMADRDSRGRLAHGERHGMTPLTAEQVATIRAEHRPGRGGNTAALAARFGVSAVTIGNITRGRTWARS